MRKLKSESDQQPVISSMKIRKSQYRLDINKHVSSGSGVKMLTEEQRSNQEFWYT